MESTNDEESSDLISCDELDNSQLDRLSVQVSSLEKLVDYCAEEFSKLVFMLVVSKPSRYFENCMFVVTVGLMENPIFMLHFTKLCNPLFLLIYCGCSCVCIYHPHTVVNFFS